jgi:hypothetical protein
LISDGFSNNLVMAVSLAVAVATAGFGVGALLAGAAVLAGALPDPAGELVFWAINPNGSHKSRKNTVFCMK